MPKILWIYPKLSFHNFHILNHAHISKSEKNIDTLDPPPLKRKPPFLGGGSGTVKQLIFGFVPRCNERLYWFLICVYFGFKYAVNSCDTAIKSLRYKFFADKSLGYHHGTQWVLTSHEDVPCRYCGHVYITITRAFEVFWVPW